MMLIWSHNFQENASLLHYAITFGDIDVIEVLLKHKTDPNFPDLVLSLFDQNIS